MHAGRIPVCGLLLVSMACGAQTAAGERVGDIEFFGYKGLDIDAVRKALPVHEGDEFSDRTTTVIREAVRAAAGKEPTDVAAICCDDRGNRLLFIGLPGASYRSFEYNRAPTGQARLSPEIIGIYRSLDAALESAARKGGENAEEDDSKGYALIKNPAARDLQLSVRRWAMEHEGELLDVLESASDVAHRRVAADALGYGRQSQGQVAALVRAARDPDDEVRNNATRALGVLARSRAGVVTPPDTFIQMMNSGVWTDRNKSAALMERLTAGRDAWLLGRVRVEALDSVMEMAKWRRPSHAYFARMVLGRVAGLPEDRLRELAWKGPVKEIVDAAGRR